nr:MAG TPA: hypothetical protein [Bacteriophage sp.]
MSILKSSDLFHNFIVPIRILFPYILNQPVAVATIP